MVNDEQLGFEAMHLFALATLDGRLRIDVDNTARYPPAEIRRRVGRANKQTIRYNRIRSVEHTVYYLIMKRPGGAPLDIPGILYVGH